LTNPKLSNSIQHIAVIRLSAMGDVAMTVPVIRALVAQYPKLKITIITRPFFKPLFENIPNVGFFDFDEKVRHKGFFGLMRLFHDLNPLEIDAFADLHNVLRAKVIRNLFSLSGKLVAAVNKGNTQKKALTRFENKVFEQLPTMFERHVTVFEELGFPIDIKKPTFPEKAILDPVIFNFIGTKNQKWIGIAPFAQYDSKIYPLDLMRQVIHELALNPYYKILLFGGGAKEVKTLNTIAVSYPNVISVAGKIKFNQEIQLISNLDLMLSMDSGNAHIAAMLGVEVITLWGATHPFAGFSPFMQPLENALVSDRERFPMLPTSVYGNKKIEGYSDVMRTILPVDVIRCIEGKLGVKS
jgi:ADP-heptose:LPS heptosyltransferase